MEAASAMSMDRLFGKIKQLPTIPKLLHELMQSFNDENARIDEIAAKIAMDQVISVKVLRMANSAALRRGNEITSIEQAVIRLGFNRLRSVVVASGIISSFKAPPGFDKLHFWTQTFQVATIARTLAQQTTSVDPETAFTCALIHNIGELLIQSTLPEEAELIDLAIEKGSSRVDAQREMLGYDYAQLGAELARRWNLSPAFVDAIAQQLDPLSHDPVSKEAVLIRLAVFVSFAWQAGVPAQAIIARFPRTLADQLGLDPASLADQLEQLHEQGNALADLLTQ
ncbi:HDOD domain-containing protein [Aeromonas caviae]|uniref:HDOD domain-containing protein n=1 Tax=Aeromonas caviae TaxID=648 RepID=UPI0029DBECB2|nr:HDOD domain-containing protein [Aeromonas caviae]MDX7754978.1 HDOD domain-containing protein [Aeromonas caviae]MDX7773157.1 HDOD domain-containing protein [Aeromonas caviae]